MPLAVRRGGVGAGARGAALSPPPALSRGGAIGGGVVYCRWGATEGLGGAARALRCVSNGPRGGGASLAVMRLGAGYFDYFELENY